MVAGRHNGRRFTHANQKALSAQVNPVLFLSYSQRDSKTRNVPPFLFETRNLPDAVRDVPPEVSSQDGLEIKVCLRTYRMFYVSRTEDVMWKFRGKEEMEKLSVQLRARNRLRRRWMENEKEEASGKTGLGVERELLLLPDSSIPDVGVSAPES